MPLEGDGRSEHLDVSHAVAVYIDKCYKTILNGRRGRSRRIVCRRARNLGGLGRFIASSQRLLGWSTRRRYGAASSPTNSVGGLTDDGQAAAGGA